MSVLDDMIKEALILQRKINYNIIHLKEDEKYFTNDQLNEISEIKNKMEKELLPELNKLEKNNKIGNNSSI